MLKDREGRGSGSVIYMMPPRVQIDHQDSLLGKHWYEYDIDYIKTQASAEIRLRPNDAVGAEFFCRVYRTTSGNLAGGSRPTYHIKIKKCKCIYKVSIRNIYWGGA